MLGLIGGLMGGATNMYQTAVNARVARENTDKTIAANREMAEYQYSKDLEMWNRGNEYNSPASQRARLEEAGLNPNLVYGSGSVTGNTTGSLPQYHAPTAKYEYQPQIDLPSVISQFQDVQIRAKQADLLDQQIKVAENNANLKALDIPWFQSRNDVQLSGSGESNTWIQNAVKSLWQAREAQTKNMSSVYDLDMKKALQDETIRKVLRTNDLLDVNYKDKLSQMEKRDLEIAKLQKDLNWYTTKAISDLVLKAAGSVGVGKLISGSKTVAKGLNQSYKGRLPSSFKPNNLQTQSMLYDLGKSKF